MLGSLVPVFKGKGNTLNPDFDRGIKLLEHAFKLYKKVWMGICIRWYILIECNMGLCQGKGLLMLCLF